MFENIEIGTNYLVIGLIVLALVCIYLLYTSLTAGSQYSGLKKNINDLILQNKKRDEIIHFLVGQVQMIQSEPPIKELNTTPNNNLETDVEDNIVELDDADMAELDELLSTNTGEPLQQTNVIEELPSVVYEEEDELDEEETTIVDDNDETQDQEEAETGLEAVAEEDPQESDSSIDEILDNSNNGLPAKDKEMLGIYTVTELKDIAKRLNITVYGNKAKIIEKVYEAL